MLDYETLLIIDPNLSEEEVEGLAQKITKGLEELGAAMINKENWGKRRLTYEVKKSKKGYYLIYDYSVDSQNFPKKVDGMLRYNESILKYMTIRMEESVPRSASSEDISSGTTDTGVAVENEQTEEVRE
ncbi:MAG: 30S ribosomal protein S6 [bacterium]